MRDFLIDRQARGLSPKTVDWYRQKLGVVRRELEELGVDQVVGIRPTTIRALLPFLLDSGLRRAEFQVLDVGHVNLDNSAVLVLRGKGGKYRAAFLHHLTRHIRPRWCRSRAIAESLGPWTIGRGTTKI